MLTLNFLHSHEKNSILPIFQHILPIYDDNNKNYLFDHLHINSDIDMKYNILPINNLDLNSKVNRIQIDIINMTLELVPRNGSNRTGKKLFHLEVILKLRDTSILVFANIQSL